MSAIQERATAIDILERSMIDKLRDGDPAYYKIELPITHRFTPGMYIREIFMPAGAKVVSMEHLTEHPFVISQGKVAVMSENEGEVLYTAPHTGITKPGTRRILSVIEDTIWTTFHVTNETDPEKVVLSVTAPSRNPLIDHDDPLANVWKHSPQRIETK